MGSWSPFGLLPNLDKKHWPDDLWAGDEERGKHIANRRFTLAGCDISFSRHIGWYSKEGSVQWLRALHSFSWIRDVVAYDRHKKDEKPKSSAKLLRNFVEDWIFASDRQHPIAREPEVMGERVASWVQYAPLLQKNAPPLFRRRLLYSMVRQALALRSMLRMQEGVAQLAAIKGVLYASLTIPQCGFMYQDALKNLQIHLDSLTDLEQHPQVRNPYYLHSTLRHLIDIQSTLHKLAHKDDVQMDDVIFALGRMLQHVLHNDGGFALFNGATEGKPAAIAQTSAQAMQVDMPAIAERAAEQTTPSAMMERTGYARLEAATSVVLVDAAPPAQQQQKDSYYGTLSFEFSHGLQRYVVNCGAFIGNDPAWSRVVKATAAHSTICIDDRNSCQFHANATPQLHLDERHEMPTIQRRLVDRDGYCFFEGIYNGYQPYSGLIHTRQLLMNDSGTRFSGADHLKLSDASANARSHDVNLRFHLHPSVQVKRLMNGMVLLSSADGLEEWTFHASVGQAVELEEGIYLGAGGKPVATTQIVIYAPFNPGDEWVLEWSFIKN
jgi:uncharacterized heparinase superfamily protein